MDDDQVLEYHSVHNFMKHDPMAHMACLARYSKFHLQSTGMKQTFRRWFRKTEAIQQIQRDFRPVGTRPLLSKVLQWPLYWPYARDRCQNIQQGDKHARSWTQTRRCSLYWCYTPNCRCGTTHRFFKG